MHVEILKKPTILLPKKHIILISHMRANTTLLGHIFGSHPLVSGYYEQHIGYYSWKSLLHSKLKFYSENKHQSLTKYYFDKILHNEHHISEKILKHKDVYLFFMLRKPERTIKSIINLYKKIDPNNDYASSEFATKYYIDRLEKICLIACEYAKSKKIFYLDAENIVNDTRNILLKLSNWFDLSPALDSHYQLFSLSGKQFYGDSSKKIKYGYVSNSKSKYDNIFIEQKLLKEAEDVYYKTKNTISSLSHSKSISASSCN